MNLRFGVKIYDNDWFLRHGLSPVQAADLLADWGVTYVIAQSKFLPMSDSAVASAVTETDRRAYDALDDVGFRELLRERGIAYFACLNICFDPAFSQAHPELATIDQWGRRAKQQDWYIGLPPDREENLAHKTDLLRKAVAALKPDAVHLGFIRWPGFWETWLPGDSRSDKPEYCFSPRSVGAFNRDLGLAVPTHDPAAAARIILAQHRQAWTGWKCARTVAAIAHIRQELAAVQAGLEYSINTLPFFRADFDNAVEEVFGQDIAALAGVVDTFEVMAYHQILARPADWPAAISDDIRERSGRKAICTLQAKALYLYGMHAGGGREADISAGEFGQALATLDKSQADGVCIFTFTDLLDMMDTGKGKAMLAALKAFRA
ncbi:hypothetical protein FJ420_26535 [Mesorhizobium sp. B3-1-3]|uniref:hypothetical protein n=1 Tax=unclassified Mesorhizobium TaxID=325217 RepID=UPI0011293384|nr:MULTISPECIES: hypothetical protein [unclassified Mesorhizobium]TPI65567.1 hypothetical protein FJ420_26535 [Mesorhizobium sp. B3-1-3]TPI67255.1 hypothetical protein FJ424_11130 [Mesorhizobium sp. B3-1-8]